MSEPTEGRSFLEKYNLKEAKIISDPERKLYQKFGLARGSVKQIFGKESLARSFEANDAGHKISKIQGDVFQMPGVFLIHKGEVIKAFRHTHVGELPDYEELSVCPIGGKKKD